MRCELLIVAASVLASCHLADDPEPPACGPGKRVDKGICVLEEGPTFTIASSGGGACTVTPDVLTVPSSGTFGFKNDDSVDHVVTGADGKDWVTAKARELSPLVSITKVGRWPYQVSGCAKGGTVVVE